MTAKVVHDVLVAAGAVTAIVPAAQITVLIRPQSISPPAITVSGVSKTPVNGLRGHHGLDGNRVQVDYWATDLIVARQAAAAGRAAIQTAGHIMENELDNFDPDVSDGIYRITQEFSVWN